METKLIQICGRSEAEDLWHAGMFHSFVEKHFDNYYPFWRGNLRAIRNYIKMHGCTLGEAREALDTLYAAYDDLHVLLKYSEDGAILSGNRTRKPGIMRKIGNVWCPVCDYDDHYCQYSDLFSNMSIYPLSGLEIKKAGFSDSKSAKRFFHSIPSYKCRVSDNEIWGIDCRSVTVYRAGTLLTEKYDYIGALKSYHARKKAKFGEF